MPAAAPDTTTRDDLIDFLLKTIEGVLRPLIPANSPCTLLDFPTYSNVGDSAIWMGAEVCLRNLGAEVVYVSDERRFREDLLSARLRNGIILLTGGGNVGDLWPQRQQFREAVIARFPQHPIIQLPQSIYFRETENLNRARTIFNRHPNLTLLVRDNRSLEFARNEFTAASMLCPDMAIALGRLPPVRPQVDILWLSRTDRESTGTLSDLDPRGTERVDWVEGPRTAGRNRFQSLMRETVRRSPISGWGSMPIRLYHQQAQAQVRRGCRILSRGRVVITDRLHGHVLSLLLGVPHVLLDNNYGKVKRFYELWTKGSDLGHWADSPAEALDRARSLL